MPTTVPYSGALDDLTLSLESEGKSEHTIRAYVSDAKLFFEACHPHVIFWDELLENHERFLRLAVLYLNEGRKEWSPATTNRKVTALRYASRVIYGVDALKAYKPPRPPKGMAHPLPGGIDDVRKLINVATKPDHKALVALCGFAGLRISEARSLTHGDFFMDSHDHMWMNIKGKGDRYRKVPLSRQCRALVEPILLPQPRAPLFWQSDRALRALITRLGERAGLSRPISSHDLRMTFGTHVFGNTKDLRTTQELLGHASSSTTEVYTAVTEKAMTEAVEEL